MGPSKTFLKMSQSAQRSKGPTWRVQRSVLGSQAKEGQQKQKGPKQKALPAPPPAVGTGGGKRVKHTKAWYTSNPNTDNSAPKFRFTLYNQK